MLQRLKPRIACLTGVQLQWGVTGDKLKRQPCLTERSVMRKWTMSFQMFVMGRCQPEGSKSMIVSCCPSMVKFRTGTEQVERLSFWLPLWQHWVQKVECFKFCQMDCCHHCVQIFCYRNGPSHDLFHPRSHKGVFWQLAIITLWITAPCRGRRLHEWTSERSVANFECS